MEEKQNATAGTAAATALSTHVACVNNQINYMAVNYVNVDIDKCKRKLRQKFDKLQARIDDDPTLRDDTCWDANTKAIYKSFVSSFHNSYEAIAQAMCQRGAFKITRDTKLLQFHFAEMLLTCNRAHCVKMILDTCKKVYPCISVSTQQMAVKCGKH